MSFFPNRPETLENSVNHTATQIEKYQNSLLEQNTCLTVPTQLPNMLSCKTSFSQQLSLSMSFQSHADNNATLSLPEATVSMCNCL